MDRRYWALTVAAALATGCGVARSSEQDEKAALERRVAELEQQLAARPAAPAETAPQVEAVSPSPEPKAPARPTAASSARRPPARPVSAPVPAPVVTPQAAAAEAPAVPEPAEPAPPPVRPLRIPRGTALHIVLETALSSETSRAGDAVVARVEKAVAEDGDIVLPGGSVLEGRVIAAQSAGRVKGNARLDVAFDHIVVRGSRYRLETDGLWLVGPDSHKKDAAMVAGGAAAGAIIGAITGGSARKGAVIGGAAGTGAVLGTKGAAIVLPAGSRSTVRVSVGREILLDR